VPEYVTAVADQLVNVQIDDMRASVPADVDAPDWIALGDRRQLAIRSTFGLLATAFTPSARSTCSPRAAFSASLD
jgi:hypothetical protein